MMPACVKTLKHKGIELYQYDGTPITHYRQPAVILLHGGNCSAEYWHKIGPAIASTGRLVYALSWYQHGGSDDLPEREFVRRDIEDIAAHELTTIVDYVRYHTRKTYIDQVDIVGHSMGSLAALKFAATCPDKVRKLALMCPVVPNEFGGEPNPLPIEPYEPVPLFSLEEWQQLFYPTMDPAMVEQTWFNQQVESPAAAYMATRFTAQVNVRRVTADTLVLTADPSLDFITPPALALDMAAAMGAATHTVDGAGHSEVLEKPVAWREAAMRVIEHLDADQLPM